MSLALLDEAIEKLPDPDGVPGCELTAVCARRDRLDAWIAAAVGAVDRDGHFELDGATSTAGWLKHRCRMTGADAQALASLARKLQALPHTTQAWRDGTLSSGQVRVIGANVPMRHLDRYADTEAAMLHAFRSLSVHETTDVMRRWLSAANDADPAPEQPERPDTLHVSETLDGRRELRGHLCGDSAIELEQALAHAGSGDPAVPLSQRNADALLDIARFFNNHNDKPAGRRNRQHLTVLVRADDNDQPVGRTLGGTPVSQSKLRQWLCDSTVARMMTSKSHILDYGTSVRTVPAHLWRAVAARDQGCRKDGCHRPVNWCEAHHVHPVEHGGPTDITNLVLLCSRDHHRLHKPGSSAKLDPDGTFHITAPDGETRTTHPPGLRDTLWPPGAE
jgi:hypothetical protein